MKRVLIAVSLVLLLLVLSASLSPGRHPMSGQVAEAARTCDPFQRQSCVDSGGGWNPYCCTCTFPSDTQACWDAGGRWDSCNLVCIFP